MKESQRKGGPGQNDEWETPPALFKRLNEEFGFKVDAAATAMNNLVTLFWGKEQEGLSWQWHTHGPIWCNPPYSDVSPWIEKASECMDLGGTAVMLLTVTPETKPWKQWIIGEADEVRFCDRRIRFYENGKPFVTRHKDDCPLGCTKHGKPASHTLPSSVVVFRPHNGPTRYVSWEVPTIGGDDG